MWPFKRKPESPEEKAALAKLDEVTREVSAEEFQKEADRERSTIFNPEFGVPGPAPDAVLGRYRPFRWKKGDPVPEPIEDEDPGDEHGLRDSLRKGEEEYEAHHPGETS
jgi:hypothetical protein